MFKQYICVQFNNFYVITEYLKMVLRPFGMCGVQTSSHLYDTNWTHVI